MVSPVSINCCSLATLDFLKTLPWVDQRAIGIMGWSLGGIMSVFAASGSDRFQAAVDQAGPRQGGAEAC
jgi:dipeptidyl aminopeptidase/acylaminoacyl peptidase